MKLRHWLAVSLLLNLALLGVVASRWRHAGGGTAPAKPVSVPTAGVPPTGGAGTAESRDDAAPRSLVDVRDALRAAGVAPEIVEQVLGAALQKQRARGKRASSWWRGTPYGSVLRFADPVEMQRQREELQGLLGASSPSADLGGEPDLSFLPESKRGEVSRVLRDYAEVGARFSVDGLRTAGDRDRERLLREEMQRDLRKVLTAEEYLEYALHDSDSQDWIRLRMDADSLALTEREFRDTARALLAARALQDEQARLKEVERIHAELRERVGADRIFAASARQSHDFYQLREAQVRFGFSEAATENVLTAWKRAAEAAELLRAQAKEPRDQSEAWRALARETRKNVVAALGEEAGTAYAEQSMFWLRDWERGADTRMAGFMFRK